MGVSLELDEREERLGVLLTTESFVCPLLWVHYISTMDRFLEWRHWNHEKK